MICSEISVTIKIVKDYSSTDSKMKAGETKWRQKWLGKAFGVQGRAEGEEQKGEMLYLSPKMFDM